MCAAVINSEKVHIMRISEKVHIARSSENRYNEIAVNRFDKQKISIPECRIRKRKEKKQ